MTTTPAPQQRIALVATDLDGTLLRSDRTINAWTRSVLDACRARGVMVVPVTARQPLGLAPLATMCGFDEDPATGWAICVNGALGINLGTGEVAFEHLLDVASQQALAEAVLAALPETRFVSVRDRGHTFAAQRGYAALAGFTDHHRDPATMSALELPEVLGRPSLKLVARHPELGTAELLDAVTQLAVPGVEATISGANFVECSAAGTTKGSGLDELCDVLGIGAGQVVAFGDAHNDIAMLRWATTSYAMDHADARVRAAADALAGDNDDDGVARILMDLMRAGRL